MTIAAPRRRILRASLAAVVAAALCAPALPAAAGSPRPVGAAASHPTALATDAAPRRVIEPTTETARAATVEASVSDSGATASRLAAAAVTGVVADPDGAPLSGIEVTAFREEAAGYELVTTVATGPDGAYAFAGLAPGAYDFFFDPVGRSGLAWGWTAGGINPARGGAVTVGDQAVDLGQHTLAAAAHIDGVVGGEPRPGSVLSDVETVLWGSDGPDADTGIAEFSRIGGSADGVFAFPQLPAGFYLVEYVSTSGEFRSEWFDDATTFETATAIPLDAGGAARADTELSWQVNLGTVSVGGTPTTGATLTALHNRRSGETYRYRWLADGVAISGATSATYKVPTSMQHKRLSVKVAGSAPWAYSSSATSAATPRVMLTTAISISGKRAIFQDVFSDFTFSVLSVKRGSWTAGATLTHQWYRDGQPISGATGSSYRLQHVDVMTRITVKTTARRAGYATVTRTSPATLKIPQAGSLNLSGPQRAGTPISYYGMGDWTAGTTRVFRVYVDGRLIDSAKLTTGWFPRLWADIPEWAIGKRATMTITGTKPGYETIVVSGVSHPIQPPYR